MKSLESSKACSSMICRQVAAMIIMLAIVKLHQNIAESMQVYCPSFRRMQISNVVIEKLSENNHEILVKPWEETPTEDRARNTEQNRRTDMSFFVPGEVNKIAKLLRTMGELVEESKRLHLSALRPLLGNATKVIWIDFANTANRGDSAINLGQINLFSALGLDVISTCHYQRKSSDVVRAKELAGQYRRDDVVVLSSGGGSIGVWDNIDKLRFEEMNVLHDYKIIILPQSIWFYDDENMQSSKEKYSQFKDLTVLLRDERSYNLAQKVFTNAPSFLVPDMAFHLGTVRRFSAPTHNIRWLERDDKETAGPYDGDLPDDLTIIKGDWRSTPVPSADTLVDHTYSATATGFLILQQGQIVITDRLHAVIMASLLEIPTVFIDNGIGKLSSYINTWMSGVDKITMATNGSDAIRKARSILEKHRHSLPVISTDNA